MEVPASTSHRVIVGLALIAAALTVWIIRPFWAALFLAAVFAGALRGPMEWLSSKLRGRRSPAGLLLTVAVLLAIVLPVGALGALLVAQLLEGIDWVREVTATGGVAALVDALPGPIQNLAEQALRSPALSRQAETLPATGGQAAAAVGGAAAATTNLLFQGAMMLIALFFFLTDGRRLIGWLDRNAPLKRGQLVRLIEEFRRTSSSVLLASIATAVVQALAATLAYLIARAPVPFFLSFVTFVVALIPAVGGAVVVVLVGVIQLLTGHPISGIFLLVWGFVVVGLIDNFTRPFLLKGGMELHGGVVFFALLGGLAAFGAVGLILGPLIVNFLIAVMKLYRTDFVEAPA